MAAPPFAVSLRRGPCSLLIDAPGPLTEHAWQIIATLATLMDELGRAVDEHAEPAS